MQVLWSRGKVIIGSFSLLLICQGCGYRLGGFGEGMPSGIRTVAVPIFANHSQEPRIENLFTEAFRDQFYRIASLRAASDRGKADAFVQGEIVGASADPVSFSSDFLVREYLARVAVSIQLRRTEDGVVLWAVERLEDTQYFQSTSDALVYADNREEAFQKIARRVSEKVVTQILAGF